MNHLKYTGIRLLFQGRRVHYVLTIILEAGVRVMSEYCDQFDISKLHIDSPLFHDISALQYDIEELRFDTIEEIETRIGPDILRINSALQKAGIINQEVHISGDNILVSQRAIDIENGTSHLQSYYTSASDDHLAENDPISGAFYGIFYIPVKYQDNFRADISYRVATAQNIAFGPYMGALCALGRVTDSRLEFTDDRHIQMYSGALTALHNASHDEPTAITTDNLQELLSLDLKNEIYDPGRLRKIGRIVRQLEEYQGTFDIAYRDAVISLVGARLGIYGNATFAVQALSLCAKQGDETTFFAKTGYHRMAFYDLGFAPHHWRQKGEIVLSPHNSETLSLATYTVLENGDELETAPLYVPLERLRSFEPYQ